MSRNILITGKTGYIGNALEKFFIAQGDRVERLSVRRQTWQEKDFSKFDVVIHLAALVHNNTPHARLTDYFKVNYELTKNLANLVKKAGVNKFIFLSTMSVYGEEGSLTSTVKINRYTKCNPTTYYGLTKYKAETMLEDLANNQFQVNIIRPPMVYGKNSPGNFSRLLKMSKINFIYPKISNQRSVIYIDDLVYHINQLIKYDGTTLTHPQNKDYMDTNQTLMLMRKFNDKKPYLLEISYFKFLNKFLNKIGIIRKVYGNLVYDKDIDSKYNFEDKRSNFEDTIFKTIK
ncbi:NAD-dependent epimerase/dehydratase family protein [Staphylococcus hominis]|uniref:NAD-dependent epimerase/dehydratase family protein n=1 Tax=Staphylococcus hominis TaxID=1290 RepID=A0A6N0I2A6_STAHO|nr:NAD-dependent epimerase/dehydratase family protein [Staphylococcus hominis]MCI2870402.1 NAD-dependent epimerase/dehydratase family protein [Staphylococcus hominis]MCI2874670.1 NAD-dependent epimerase/dehydratase family protein [Staphylococcus hominis]MCI2890463.1 NAD-dependent epimerase/dehydratase family protein [Staphylococcus hominis]MDS3867086.1 NAD-dependent epimerase/dehydratase family protein [Staphylococcus hominis]QKQ28715.1 NAD-dependent epimerase/dehydratase family protein [Staph